MKRYIFCGDFDESKYHKPTHPVKVWYSKPSGCGLWASPLFKGKTAWQRWVKNLGYKHHSVISGKMYLVKPKGEIKVYQITGHNVDWDYVIDNYDAALVIPKDYKDNIHDSYDIESLWIINLDKFSLIPYTQ